jgi:hydroxymethylbilane synthase
MSRIVVGNHGSALALAYARTALAELTAEWPDVNILHKTVSRAREGDEVANDIVNALVEGKIDIALLALDSGPMPEGLTLAAVTKRLEPRSVLVTNRPVTKGGSPLAGLPADASIGVGTRRDQTFLVARQGLSAVMLSGSFDDGLSRLAAGELDALILPAATLIRLERRQRIDALLEPEQFTPAVGQGSLGLVVREDDNLAADLAYTLQHRPSFDRVLAEQSFAGALNELEGCAVGALATITEEGELTLFGALADPQGLIIQAEISGEASEAEELGGELAKDVLEQVKMIACERC